MNWSGQVGNVEAGWLVRLEQIAWLRCGGLATVASANWLVKLVLAGWCSLGGVVGAAEKAG